LLHRHCTGQAAGTGGKAMFVITYSFNNIDGARQMNSTVANRAEVSTILDMIENKDDMSYRIHSIEAA
jgi:hypothetical protein